MAFRPGMFLLVTTMAFTSSNLPLRLGFAQEGAMDTRGEAEARKALRLYKQGSYEDAALLFAKLSVDYPTMPIFERNVGACFYYLKKPEPALSNLRNYLNHKKDIAPDDKAVVDRWIAEMEQLRSQATGMPVQAPSLVGPAPPAQMPVAPAEPAPVAPVAPAQPPFGAPLPSPVVESPPPATAVYPAYPTPVPAAALPPAALDLTAQPQHEAPRRVRPFYATWWFWTGTGIVAAGAATAIILLYSSKSGSGIPTTPLGNQGAFQ